MLRHTGINLLENILRKILRSSTAIPRILRSRNAFLELVTFNFTKRDINGEQLTANVGLV